MDPETLALAPLWYVAFLFQLVCHEAAHAFVAKWGGDDTAARGGQASLNPLPHIQREILGTVVVPIISFALRGWMIGWGSAPFDPFWMGRHPHRAALMALAGPAANFLLAILTAIAIHIGLGIGAFAVPEYATFSQIVLPAGGEGSEIAASFLSIFFSLNLVLMSFNLLPVPPLDGATAIGLLMSEAQALRLYEFMRQPMMSMMGLLVAWQFFGQIFSPVFGFAVGLLYWFV